jgi:protein ImuA
MDARREVIEDLRRQIDRLHGGSPSRKSLPFGVAPIDRHLPGKKGLALGTLHEVIEHGPASEFAGTATLFTAGILARLKGPVLWCLAHRDHHRNTSYAIRAGVRIGTEALTCPGR